MAIKPQERIILKKVFSLDRKSKYLDYDYDTQGH